MIVELIVSLFVGLVSFIGGLLPDVEVPAFVDSIAGLVATVTGLMAPLGNWLPFNAAGTATAAVIVCVGVALAIRFVRMILSVFTGGGGA